jgi:hypothetical protein
MKAYITKYALSKGILELEGSNRIGNEDTFEAKTGQWMNSYHGGEWWATRDAAVERADEMRVARIASLKKQIKKLEAMRF